MKVKRVLHYLQHFRGIAQERGAGFVIIPSVVAATANVKFKISERHCSDFSPHYFNSIALTGEDTKHLNRVSHR